MKLIKDIYYTITPKKILNWKVEAKERMIWKSFKGKLRKKILSHYEGVPANELPNEYLQIINFLKTHTLQILCYDFPGKYNKSDITVYFDKTSGLRYVLYDNKKLYFKRNWNNNKIKEYYNYLLIEQDPQSPHRYLVPNFDLSNNDVVVDAGAAEGIFSLSIIDRCSKIYIFEPDLEWLEALKETFKPWREKVEISGLYLGANVSSKITTIDTYFKTTTTINFLKVDVEGYEADVLSGLEQSKNKILKIAICTYHKQNDELELSEKLIALDFDIKYSNGYVVFYFDRAIKEPYFRRCLIRATNNCSV